MSIHILGIRHHGPGSARAVAEFLERQRPDIVLVEGPPEGDMLLEWTLHEEMQPPVALLVYNPEEPQRASFYPFAVFSPEWQAITYARRTGIPVKFMDLPAAHDLALKDVDEEAAPAEASQNEAAVSGDLQSAVLHGDPMYYLAEAAGWSDGEQWWEYFFEQRRSSEGALEAVSEAMSALRATLPPRSDKREQVREAWMRRVIRQSEREMFTNIAVICGAWHLPALTDMPKVKDDNELLKSLPKVKIEATWVPWTYNRLSYYSGYGAGIHSPGWYHHLWHYPADDGRRWMSQIAALFRSKGMDTSVAHVIESVRLAESLAALRGYSKAGLQEMNEAALSIICGGDAILLQLIHDALIVSDRIGSVPAQIPRPPLQADIDKKAKALRLAQAADFKDYVLDLRKDYDLERSVFLHRLQVLGIGWGVPVRADGKGTFKEGWRLQWVPELSIAIIEKGAWGNTLETAATAYVIAQCTAEASLSVVAGLLQHVLPAALPDAAGALSETLANKAAVSHDVLELVKIIPGLARIVRYGNVRRTDADMVLQMLDSMITRVCIGLPLAAIGINEEVAKTLTDECSMVQHSVALLQREDFTSRWQACLALMADNGATVAMLRGFAVRQLMDYKVLQGDALYASFARSTSAALPPAAVAAWLEGFLTGRGTVLLIDVQLWKVVDDWVGSLSNEVFTQVLPLLRRTFATFSPAERRKMGEKAAGGGSATTLLSVADDIDHQRAAMGIPIVMKLLGLQHSQTLLLQNMSLEIRVYCRYISAALVPQIVNRLNNYDMNVEIHPDFKLDEQEHTGFLTFKFQLKNPRLDILKGKSLESGFELYVEPFNLNDEKEQLEPKHNLLRKLFGKKQEIIPFAPPEIEHRLNDCTKVISFVWSSGDSFQLRFASLTSAILTELTNGVCCYPADSIWYSNTNIVNDAFQEIEEYEQSLSGRELKFREFNGW